MPIAVTLLLDDALAGMIRTMWRDVAAATGDGAMLSLDYPPHLTLLRIEDDAAAEPVLHALSQEAAGMRRMSLTLAGIGVFPGEPSVVWAVPVVSAELLRWHRRWHERLAGLLHHSHYGLDAWVPHVTLGHAAPAMLCSAVTAALATGRGPLRGMVDRVEIVGFPPVQTLASRALAAGE
jgi:2'-5' RNA ligase